MPDPIIGQIHDWLRNHEEELLNDTVRMLQIPSVEGDPEPNAPFGKENRRALDMGLSLCQSWGFKTKDIDGYIGFGEIGQGDRMVMSLGHLDVVPVGPGWKHDPFAAEIEDGYLYARGATDDKGPTMASLYAIRAIQAVVPDLPARIRQVFGCNEESGFKCIDRYVKTEEIPTYGVAPDSGWPLIHGEKGIANLEVEVPLNQGEMALLEFGGGQRPNIVIDSASAKVRVADSARAEVEAKLADAWDRNVTVSWEGDVLGIYAIGKAAHGSRPFGGDSAAIRVLRLLKELAPVSVETYFDELFDSTHIGGNGLGIAGSDPESGPLTSNLGVVKTANGKLEMLFNIRYPVTWTGQKLESLCKAHLAKLSTPFELKVTRDSPPLYFPLDHPLVRTIVDVYREETGEDRQPTTMGGGTYARAIANTVSIGTSWAGDGAAHETNERYKIEHLFKASRIYASILYRLATMP